MSGLRISQLSVSIGMVQVCSNLSLHCKPGEVWGILGRNGKGKTTLLHTLAGLRSAQSGDIFINDSSIKNLTRRNIAQQMGLLLQQHEDSFPCSVIDTVISGRHPHINPWQWETAKDYQLAEAALNNMQLSHLTQRFTNQLSGGERQRVAMATLLTQDPDIMLLDEPNSHLDLKYQIQLLDILSALAKSKQKTILMTLHDLNLSARYCDKIIMLMGDGKALIGDTNDLLNEENLLRLYEHPIEKINANDRSVFSPR